MKLQKATRCALFAILELAAGHDRQLSANEIAERLVEAVRGAGGGYRFSGNRRRTTLLDIIQLFETIDPIRNGEREDGDDTAEGKALCQVLMEIEDTARATFASLTLDTMIKLVERNR